MYRFFSIRYIHFLYKVPSIKYFGLVRNKYFIFIFDKLIIHFTNHTFRSLLFFFGFPIINLINKYIMNITLSN